MTKIDNPSCFKADCKFLADVIDRIPDPIFVKDADHRWVLLNDAMVEIMKVDRDEVIGLSDYDLYGKEEADEFWRVDDLVLETGQQIENEEFFTDTMGTRHIISTKKSRYIDCKGDRFIIGTIRDISRRVEAEAKARAHLQQLAHAGRMVSIGELTSSISHSIGQPLSAITLYASGLLENPQQLDKNTQEVLARIQEQGERVKGIIDHLRILLRKGESVREPIEPASYLTHIVGFLRDTLREKAVTIELDYAKSLEEINIDPIQIEQVIINLIQNSIDALTEAQTPSPLIRLSARVSDSSLIILVNDNGPGIPAEHQQDVFEPFYTSKKNGMGIGLSICMSIVENHQGQLKLTPNKTDGCEFILTLPLAHPRA